MSVQPVAGQLTADAVDVVLRGEMPLGVDEYASEKVAHATRTVSRHVRGAQVVVRNTADAATPYDVEVTVDIDGTFVRAEASGARPREAVDAVLDRLGRRLSRAAERWDDRKGWLARKRVPDTARPEASTRPVDEREVVRRKSFAIGPQAPEDAAFDMEALGHDFYLFLDAATGADVLIHHREDGRYGLAGHGDGSDLPDTVVAEPDPPVLDEQAALQRLDVGGEPFVFFKDSETGRGHVAYRRLDGHYGVIVPS